VAEAASPTATSLEFRPHVFGKFFLLQRLAVGGMAEIYRARVPGAEGFEKELVVKRILPSRAQDQGFIKMLVNEAKLTVQLTHNNIAQIYECGIIDGNYFISMELVNGVSMKEMMLGFARAGAGLSPEQAIFIVLQLLQGLDYAHKRTDSQGRPLEIVHCDVSPDNALLSFEGEVKLLDFGIARAATGLSNYKEGMLMGKLGYVAPEQASLETRWDHRVDIFASGIILYEMLTQQKPFPKATDVESLIASRKTKVVPPTQIDKRLPEELDAILAKALAYDPGRRFSDARKFADALVDVLFPTPHSSIQEHLGRQMQQVFSDRIAKQRSGRAHDPLIMKVLSNAAAQQHATYQPLSGAGVPDTTPVPAPYAAPVETTPTSRARGQVRAPRPRTVVKNGVRLSTAFLFGLVVAAAGAVALHFGEIWIRPGVLVITSDPPGVPVLLDGAPTGQVTPAVVEGVVLSRKHQVAIGGGPVKAVEIPLEPEPGRMVRRVHARLASTLGSVTIDSDPPGAQVSFDERAVGRTPVTIPEVRLDDRHRIDLTLAGFEIDQFVVFPEEDGTRFRRRLKPLDRRRTGGQGTP
jgi:serine/threonine protein kinase